MATRVELKHPHSYANSGSVQLLYMPHRHSRDDNISDTVAREGGGWGCSETHVGCTLYLVSQTWFLCVCSFYWSYYEKRRRFTVSPTAYILSPYHLTVKLSLDFTIYSLTYNSLYYVVRWFETQSLSVPVTSNVMGCLVLCVILMQSIGFSVTNQGITDSIKGKQCLDRPWGFQDVQAPKFQDNRHMKVIKLSVLLTSRLYPKEIFLDTVVGENLPKAYFSKAASLELFRSRP